ncbi:hypothetical protein Dimus_022081, partial [Dionaea muscipula]
ASQEEEVEQRKSQGEANVTEQAFEAHDQSHIAQDPIVEDVVGENAQDVVAVVDSTTVVDEVERAQAAVDEVPNPSGSLRALSYCS